MSSPSPKTIVLITGANSGIGFELAAQLLAKGTYHILVGARSSQKGPAALSALLSRSPAGTAEFLALDVTSDASIAAASATVQSTHGRLDILVNNAAVATIPGSTRTQMNTAFDTNATGPAVVTAAFAPLLARSAAPRIVNIGSATGSIGRRLDPAIAMFDVQEVQYRASKAALNMVTACQWKEYAPLGFKVLLYDPGYTVSGISKYNTLEMGARSAEVSVAPLVEVVEGRRDGEELACLFDEGAYPW